MAQIFKVPKHKSKAAKRGVAATVTAEITTIDHHGQGVCGNHQPVIFAHGGLPGEQCEIKLSEQKKRYWRGQVSRVSSPNQARVEPFCPYFGLCGGCQTQHVEQQALLVFKQQAVSDLLARKLGKDTFEWYAAIYDAQRAYRRKTRLAIDGRNRGKPLLGFRAKDSKRVVSINACPVLVKELDSLLQPLQSVFGQLDNPAAIGHISMLQGENIRQVCLRMVKNLSKQDRHHLAQFAETQGCQVLLEDKEDQFECLSSPMKSVVFTPSEGIELEISTNDFIQVNDRINQQMVLQALEWLEINEQDQLLDLFCGVGNFSSPAAEKCQKVIGVEGMANMVQRASDNAHSNGLTNCQFECVDLSQPNALQNCNTQSCNKVLMDPARDGAAMVIPQVAALKPSHILYVSCNPATFVRDAELLEEHQYSLMRIGLMDMFPNTAHTELMALFVRQFD